MYTMYTVDPPLFVQVIINTYYLLYILFICIKVEFKEYIVYISFTK